MASTLYREFDVQMELGECALWDHRHNQLYWVDILEMQLYRLDWATGELAQWALPSHGGGLGLLGERELIVAVQTGLFGFDPTSGQYGFLLHPSPDTPSHRLNEGKVDPAGNFWIGTISTLGRVPECGLFRVTPDGEVKKVLADIAVPNALVFDGNDEVIFTDSAQRLIWRYRLSPDGTLNDQRVFVDDRAHSYIPDGACKDDNGLIWNAKFGGGCVVAYDGDGRMVTKIDLPVKQITSCAFCGPNFDYLAVTTAKRLLTDDERMTQPRAGNLFIYQTAAIGVEEPVCPSMRNENG